MKRKRSVLDLSDSELAGRRVLVRVDFNVPIEKGEVADDTRIVATIPTLRHLLERRSKVILMSHLGRPGGRPDPSLTLAPVAARLRERVDRPVHFVEAVRGEGVRAAVERLGPGEILLLENVRFDPDEESDDAGLGSELAGLADVYVNDAFGTAHRAHATTSAAAAAVKAAGRPAVAGLLIDRELRFLGQALERPRRPFVAVLGGAKISGKIDVVEALLPKVDALLIGGAMANTFFRAMGLETGDSLVETDRVEMAGDLMRRAGAKLVLPLDCVVAAQAVAGAAKRVVGRADVPAGLRILDIGPATVRDFAARVRESGTVLWNGPMGLFEIADFRAGTDGLARSIAEATARGAVTIVGGGDTAAALEQAGLAAAVTHVSTGGGASLEFLEGRVLPGIAVLDDAQNGDRKP